MSGQTLEVHLAGGPLYWRGPEAVLPGRALVTDRKLRHLPLTGTRPLKSQLE